MVQRDPEAEPEVLDLPPPSGQPLGEIVALVCEQLGTLDGDIPVDSVREVVENLVHARCRDAVVMILHGGRTVVVSDHGPGIADKSKALAYGYTTASEDLRRYIRGVGAGLPRAKAALETCGGVLSLDDNMGGGTVVTLDTTGRQVAVQAEQETPGPPRRALTARKRHVLMLLADLGTAGPSVIARELGVGLSTAFRELAELESLGLAKPLGKGKRALTEKAARNLMELLGGSD